MVRSDLAQSFPVTILGEDHDHLGEGPVWDDRRGQLLRVDITGEAVITFDPSEETTARFRAGGEVSAVIPRESGGVLLTVGHEVVALSSDGVRETLAIVEDDKPDNRFNDCRCDPQGRLWAGTMNKNRVPGTAALYRMAPGESMAVVVAPTTLSNGIGWSPASDRMYFIDSTEQRVDVFDFDGTTGAISSRRCFVQVPAEDGLPDGLSVDAEGGVWLCLFGGGQIRRYDETGVLSAVVSLPVTNPTCPTFGGPDLRTLYITSARHRLSRAQLACEPAAGAVLVLEPGVSGLPLNRFAG
jgi:sugar lactone lactonase YvrE